MKVLIVYGTSEGQTRKIAQFMEQIMVEAGHQVTVFDSTDSPPSPEGFEAVLVGGSIHIGKYQSALTHYIKKNVTALNNLPSAFFSVCMAIASKIEDEHREIEKITRNYLEQAEWQPALTTQIAGALKYTEYDFFKRLIMKMISKREGGSTDTSNDHEYTDWDAVKKFVLEFCSITSRKS